MELRTRRAVKRMRADSGSSVTDRTCTSGSLGKVSQLCSTYSDSEAAVSTAQIPLASGLAGTHSWNTLGLDLQERILMHLPLQELGRAVCLGKAFRSAFQQRALQVEQGLTSAGVAAFGRPLLEGVGRVLQRYRQRTDLATGCGAMRLEQWVVIDRCGTVTAGSDDLITSAWMCNEPEASVELHRHPGRKDVIEAQDLRVWVSSPKRKHWACLELRGATRRSSAHLCNEAADLCVRQCGCLGAMFIIAHQAGEEPTCRDSGASPQQELAAHAVDPPFPGGGESVQHAQGDSPGTPFEASRENLHPPPRRVAAGHIRRVCASTGFSVGQQVSGELVEQGMITALKLAEGFRVPCCKVALGSDVTLLTCENNRYCGKYRVRA